MPQERQGRNGGTLKSRQKGDSALPGAGRPKGSKSWKTTLNKYLEEKISDEELGETVEYRDAIAFKLIKDALTAADPNVRRLAASLIMDRTEGKATQGVELSGADGGPIAIDGASEVPESILEKMVKIVKDGK